MFGIFCKLLAKFRKSNSGVVAIIFVIMMPSLLSIGIVGLDISTTNSVKNSIQSASETSAIATVNKALSYDDDLEKTNVDYNYFMGDSPQINMGKDVFNALFNETVSKRTNNIKAVYYTISIKNNKGVYTSKINYWTSYTPIISKIFPMSPWNIEGVADATITVTPAGFTDIKLLLDTSGSMNMGASASDINWLKAHGDCAFDCHNTRPYYVKTRMDVLKSSLNDIFSNAESTASKVGEPRIRFDITTFNNSISKLSLPTTNYVDLRNKVSSIYLDDKIAGTRITDAIATLAYSLPYINNNNGTSFDKSKGVVIIITDGMEDRYLEDSSGVRWSALTFGGPYGYDQFYSDAIRTGAPNSKYCNIMKDKGYIVAVIYTTYLDIIARYDLQNDGIRAAINIRLWECATKDFFIEASDGSAITAAVKKIYKQAIIASPPRVSF